MRWLEHLKRHPGFPAAQLLEIQDDLWLQTLRALHPTADGVSLLAGRTGTRGGAGKPTRWSALWVAALTEELGVDNAFRDKTLTRERAMMVEAMIKHGRWHGRATAQFSVFRIFYGVFVLGLWTHDSLEQNRTEQ